MIRAAAFGVLAYLLSIVFTPAAYWLADFVAAVAAHPRR